MIAHTTSLKAFEERYDAKKHGLCHVSPETRCLRMLREVAACAHQMGKEGADLGSIDLVIRRDGATLEDVLEIVIRPKLKLGKPMRPVRVSENS